MTNTPLKKEIANLLCYVKEIYGKNSMPFHDLENYLDMLEGDYKHFAYSGYTLDYISDYKKLIGRIIEEQKLNKVEFDLKYANINKMISYLIKYTPEE